MVKQTMVDSAVTFLVATANAYGYLAVRTGCHYRPNR